MIQNLLDPETLVRFHAIINCGSGLKKKGILERNWESMKSFRNSIMDKETYVINKNDNL